MTAYADGPLARPVLIGGDRAWMGCQGVGMTPPQRSTAPDSAAVRTSVRRAVPVALLLATFGGSGLAFGAMTACTDDYSCTACAPCATVNSRVSAHWAAQVALAGLASVRVRPLVIPEPRRHHAAALTA